MLEVRNAYFTMFRVCEKKTENSRLRLILLISFYRSVHLIAFFELRTFYENNVPVIMTSINEMIRRGRFRGSFSVIRNENGTLTETETHRFYSKRNNNNVIRR